jgi:hypothetical protein
MRRRASGEPVDYTVERIRRTARMRSGMVAGLIVVALVQILPGIGHESFEALVRELMPALILGCVGLPAAAWIARRDERRVRRTRTALRPR